MISGVDLYHGDAMVDPNLFDFVFHKATQGTWFTDASCQDRMTLVRDAGKLAGMYHFLSTQDPIPAQVDFFLYKANPQSGDVLALDFENDGYWTKVAPITLGDMASQFMTELVRQCPSNRAILYCNMSTFNNIVSPLKTYHADGLWLADPTGPPGVGEMFWQYASDTVDRDYGHFADLVQAREWAMSAQIVPSATAQAFTLLEG